MRRWCLWRRGRPVWINKAQHGTSTRSEWDCYSVKHTAILFLMMFFLTQTGDTDRGNNRGRHCVRFHWIVGSLLVV